MLTPDLHWAPPELRYPKAATLARLGRRRLQRGLTTPPHLLHPAYLRPALRDLPGVPAFHEPP
uniref:Uncharacterized protein n=1 Tax=Desulfobacca acetoxidans TaxID=60893 RepID=A0A7C5EPE7_9BACT